MYRSNKNTATIRGCYHYLTVLKRLITDVVKDLSGSAARAPWFSADLLSKTNLNQTEAGAAGMR